MSPLNLSLPQSKAQQVEGKSQGHGQGQGECNNQTVFRLKHIKIALPISNRQILLDVRVAGSGLYSRSLRTR